MKAGAKAQGCANAWVQDSVGMEDLKFKKVGGARSLMARGCRAGGEGWWSLYYPGTSGRWRDPNCGPLLQQDRS